MAIHVACSCGKRLHARPELAGKRVKCPACKVSFVVPGSPPLTPAAPRVEAELLDDIPEVLPADPSFSASQKRHQAPQTNWVLPVSGAGLFGLALILVLVAFSLHGGETVEQYWDKANNRWGPAKVIDDPWWEARTSVYVIAGAVSLLGVGLVLVGRPWQWFAGPPSPSSRPCKTRGDAPDPPARRRATGEERLMGGRERDTRRG